MNNKLIKLLNIKQDEQIKDLIGNENNKLKFS